MKLDFPSKTRKGKRGLPAKVRAVSTLGDWSQFRTTGPPCTRLGDSGAQPPGASLTAIASLWEAPVNLRKSQTSRDLPPNEGATSHQKLEKGSGRGEGGGGRPRNLPVALCRYELPATKLLHRHEQAMHRSVFDLVGDPSLNPADLIFRLERHIEQ